MTKLRESRHFTVLHEHSEAAPEDLATEVIEHAKGGHHVALVLPSGAAVDIHPEDDHAAVVQKIAEAMPSKEPTGPSRGRKGGLADG